MNKYETIKDLLFDDYKEKSLKHAYIFESSDLSLALRLARQLGSLILETQEIDNVSDFNFIKKEDMNIQTIRNITKDSLVKPFKNKKLYVFEDSMKFTIPMQNAFLKTLEEPPEDVIFILLTENANTLLDTVRSRCIRYFFDEEISEISQREDITLKTRQLFDILISKDKVKMVEYMEEIKKYKNDIDDILTSILDNSRNIMIAKESINLLPDEHKQNKYIHDIINKFTYYQLLTIIDITEETRRRLNRNCSFSMTIELMLLNMMEVGS